MFKPAAAAAAGRRLPVHFERCLDSGTRPASMSQMTPQGYQHPVQYMGTRDFWTLQQLQHCWSSSGRTMSEASYLHLRTNPLPTAGMLLRFLLLCLPQVSVERRHSKGGPQGRGGRGARNATNIDICCTGAVCVREKIIYRSNSRLIVHLPALLMHAHSLIFLAHACNNCYTGLFPDLFIV